MNHGDVAICTSGVRLQDTTYMHIWGQATRYDIGTDYHLNFVSILSNSIDVPCCSI